MVQALGGYEIVCLVVAKITFTSSVILHLKYKIESFISTVNS